MGQDIYPQAQWQTALNRLHKMILIYEPLSSLSLDYCKPIIWRKRNILETPHGFWVTQANSINPGKFLRRDERNAL